MADHPVRAAASIVLAGILLAVTGGCAPSVAVHPPGALSAPPAKASTAGDGTLLIGATVDAAGRQPVTENLVQPKSGVATVFLQFTNGLGATSGTVTALVDFVDAAAPTRFFLPDRQSEVRLAFPIPSDRAGHDLRILVRLATLSDARSARRTFGIAARIATMGGRDAATIARARCGAVATGDAVAGAEVGGAAIGAAVGAAGDAAVGAAVGSAPIDGESGPSLTPGGATGLSASSGRSAFGSPRVITVVRDGVTLSGELQFGRGPVTCGVAAAAESFTATVRNAVRGEYELVEWSVGRPTRGHVALQGISAMEASPRLEVGDDGD